MTRNLKRAVLVGSLLVKLLLGHEPALDTEETDILLESEKRWARQNHSAAEGLGVPGDYDQVKRLAFNFTENSKRGRTCD